MSTAVEHREQALVALAEANRIRLSNAATFRAIRRMEPGHARAAIATVLRSPEGAEGSMRVGHLLRCARWIGDRKVGELLAQAGTSDERRRVAELTVRQRRVIADAVTR